MRLFVICTQSCFNLVVMSLLPLQLPHPAAFGTENEFLNETSPVSLFIEATFSVSHNETLPTVHNNINDWIIVG